MHIFNYKEKYILTAKNSRRKYSIKQIRIRLVNVYCDFQLLIILTKFITNNIMTVIPN